MSARFGLVGVVALLTGCAIGVDQRVKNKEPNPRVTHQVAQNDCALGGLRGWLPHRAYNIYGATNATVVVLRASRATCPGESTVPPEPSEAERKSVHLRAFWQALHPLQRIRLIQAALAVLDYIPGPITGYITDKTNEAIGRFVRDDGLAMPSSNDPRQMESLFLALAARAESKGLEIEHLVLNVAGESGKLRFASNQRDVHRRRMENHSGRSAADLTESNSSTLTLTSAREAWIRVKQKDGTILFVGHVKPGQTQRLTGVPPYKLTIGRSTSVLVTHRGKLIDLRPHSRGDVARLELR